MFCNVRDFEWFWMLLVCVRIASSQTFLDSFIGELEKWQMLLDYDVVYECSFVQDITNSPEIYSSCVDDSLVDSSGDMTKLLLFDWNADQSAEEHCQCAAVALVLLSVNGDLGGLCDATSNSSIGCNVVCTSDNDMECSFAECDSTGMTEEVCVLYNNMMASIQIGEEEVQLFLISKGLQCNVIRDFNQEICPSLFDDSVSIQVYVIIVLCVGIILGAILIAVAMVACYCLKTTYNKRRNGKQVVDKVPKGSVVETEMMESFREQQSCLIPAEQMKRYESALASVLCSSQEIRTICEIGQGAFGKVERGRMVTENGGYSMEVEVAIKSLKEASPELVEDFISESIIMLDFNHPNVIKLLGVCFDTENNLPLIILPYMANGDLKSFLVKKRQGNKIDTLPEDLRLIDLVNMCLDIARGMRYLAQLKFVHRDLAARNCMVDCDLTVKVADFGFSRDVCSKEYYRLKRGTRLPVKWLPPESLLDNIYNEKTDVWSFGVTCWELMSLGRTPYPGVDNIDLVDHINSGKRLNQPPLCTNSLYEVIQECWLGSGDERPTFSDVVVLLEKEKMILMEMNFELNSHTPVDRPYFVLDNPASITVPHITD